MRQLSDDELMHVGRSKRDGAPVGSGRYPLGSGDKPFQHATDFLGRIKELQSEGLTEKEIATYLGLESTTQLRVQRSIARAEERSEKVAQARALYEQGMNTYQIAKEMGYPNESSVRSLLNESSEARMNMAKKTAEFLKSQVDKKGMIDVGAGVEHELGVSKEKLHEALEILKLEGYEVYGGVNAPYIWLKTPNNMTSWEFFDYLLEKANVVGTPGVGFGPEGEHYYRLTAFGNRENTIEAIDRIVAM